MRRKVRNPSVLPEFFAVTLTSLYRVRHAGAADAEVVKIALRGKSSIAVGERLNTSPMMVAVCQSLQMFIPERYGLMHPLAGIQREVAMVNTRYWGGCSSAIVALFFDEKDARTCLASDALVAADLRWVDSTRAVLAAIGDNHPSFTISHFPSLELLHNETTLADASKSTGQPDK